MNQSCSILVSTCTVNVSAKTCVKTFILQLWISDVTKGRERVKSWPFVQASYSSLEFVPISIHPPTQVLVITVLYIS
jgi:hypothetical protein